MTRKQGLGSQKAGGNWMEQSPFEPRSQIVAIGAANGFDSEALTEHFENWLTKLKMFH